MQQGSETPSVAASNEREGRVLEWLKCLTMLLSGQRAGMLGRTLVKLIAGGTQRSSEEQALMSQFIYQEWVSDALW